MIEIKLNYASLKNLISFYYENNNTFIPPLNTQVKSLKEYIKKIKKNAVIFEAWDNNKLIGLIAAYFNNYETKTGFITSVIISTEYQKKGIGKLLLKKTIEFAEINSFNKIQLEVNKENEIAINLYEKFGFVIDIKDLLSMTLDLNKKV